MNWFCAAIDHGVTLRQNGTITPCCMIDNSYSKPIADIDNDPFADLRTGKPPRECEACHSVERHGLASWRHWHNRNKTAAPGYQFIDIRNSNLCNYKCRTCYPGNSSQWATELGHPISIVNQALDSVKTHIVNPSVTSIYYTGGEPFINAEFWQLLQELVDTNLSSNISLTLNTNLSTLKYKQVSIFDLFAKFKVVNMNCSIDAVGPAFNYLRSGGEWTTVENNLYLLRDYAQRNTNLNVGISCTVGILNIWFVEELLTQLQDFDISLNPVRHPEQLALSSVPDSLKNLALDCVDAIRLQHHDQAKCDLLRAQIENNSTQHLFNDTLLHVLILDQVRNEKLFDLLPFKQEALSRLVI